MQLAGVGAGRPSAGCQDLLCWLCGQAGGRTHTDYFLSVEQFLEVSIAGDRLVGF